MATLVFSSIGTALGGPVGGAIGALMGRQIDGAVFGSGQRSSGRLADLTPTDSTYGQVLPRHFGRMRVGGSIIWATDLVEHSTIEGGTKGATALTAYTYSANFAVALASRPITGIGRIWADGNLLRGAEGDLKVAGTLRIHTGEGNQTPDPLILASEGEALTPAHRDLAYVVFENLDLSEYYNRIPTLTFEVLAGGDFTPADLIGELLDDADITATIAGIEGFSHTGSLADTLDTIDQVVPLASHVEAETLVFERRDLVRSTSPLGEATASGEDDAFGASSGWTRSRAAPPARPSAALRYYDPDRDYLPGLQRATGRPAPGQPATIELPATLGAATARALIETTARRIDWSRDQIAWRTRELDPTIHPGSFVTLPDLAGTWRVGAWEWREAGVELALERCAPTGADTVADLMTSAGRAGTAADETAAPTLLQALELPDDGRGQALSTRRILAATSSPSAGWRGASLYLVDGTGNLTAAGTAGRSRAVLGATISVLGTAHPACFDRRASLDIQLAATDMLLVPASPEDLTQGANLALVGDELIQFAEATTLGQGRWKLRGLLRGRGGTESGIPTHRAGEPFVLLNGQVTALTADSGTSRIAASALGDPAPVVSEVRLSGLSLRPPSPVHPRVIALADGTVRFEWTRRSRGGWNWNDGIDVPLAEETERYIVTAGPDDLPLARWTVETPQLVLAAADVQALSGQPVRVRQQGTFALSAPLLLAVLA